MRVAASLFRIVDLWYRIGAEWPRVARGVLGWCGLAAAALLVLHGTSRTAFACGLAGYAAVHVAVYAGTQAWVRMYYRSRRRVF